MKKAVIKKAVNGEYYITLIAKNGRVILSGSEDTHKRKSHCINICKKHFPDFKIIDKTEV